MFSLYEGMECAYVTYRHLISRMSNYINHGLQIKVKFISDIIFIYYEHDPPHNLKIFFSVNLHSTVLIYNFLDLWTYMYIH